MGVRRARGGLANNTGARWCCGWHPDRIAAASPAGSHGCAHAHAPLCPGWEGTSCARGAKSAEDLASYKETQASQRGAPAWGQDDRAADTHLRSSFSLPFLNRSWKPPGCGRVMTVNAWEQRACHGRLFPWRTKGRCSAPAPSTRPARPLRPGSPSPSQGAWVGPWPAHISAGGVGAGFRR